LQANNSKNLSSKSAFSTERSTLAKPEHPAANKPKGQARPTEERFLLRVDGQSKRSFRSKDPAMMAGSAIKKAFPIVMVTVEDTKDGTIELITP
jgi:hypothetical protein